MKLPQEEKEHCLGKSSEAPRYFKASKALGQNYLHDKNLIRKITEAANIESTDTVLEIGPGPGALTEFLLLSPAQKIIIVEKDKQFIEYWNKRAEGIPKLQVIHADALKIKLKDVSLSPIKIISNLPYNVGTALLLRWFDELALIHSMTLMFQKEVVLRMLANPGTKDYGRLSILTQWICQGERLFDVPPTAFRPQPKVVSSVIQLFPRKAPLFPARKESLEKITATAFQQRRKTLKKSLHTLFSDPVSILESLYIDPMQRAETLTIEQFCTLAQKL